MEINFSAPRILRKSLVTVLFLTCFATSTYAQRDSSRYLVNFYYGLGTSIPLGSFSENTSKQNELGKSSVGLNITAGAEYYVNRHYTLGIDFCNSIFTKVSNPKLQKEVDGLMETRPEALIANDQKFFDVIISNVALSTSRLFYLGKFAIQTRVSVGMGKFGYDYVVQYFASSPTIAVNSYSSNIGSYSYACNDVVFFTFKPEINLRYLFLEKKRLNWEFNLGASYQFLKPGIDVYEIETNTKGSTSRKVLSLKDEVQTLNVYFGVNLTLKKAKKKG